jgi:hypothetical protein
MTAGKPAVAQLHAAPAIDNGPMSKPSPTKMRRGGIKAKVKAQ